ncbi:MAG: response regulator [Lachnospiraceae bacterium]|nr:response regulator [Lachnospiraceae bacterium]
MKDSFTKQFIASIALIFILLSLMLGVILGAFYKTASNDVRNLGVSNLKSQAAQVDNYLDKGGNVLWFAADSVEYLLSIDADHGEIEEYLTKETGRMTQQFDDNFTGIYGFVDGQYMDGSGWIPPDGYNPVKRDWYNDAREARGEMVLSAPYVDAQTKEIIVSFSQMLSDGTSVLALDIIMNEVQNITEHMTMGGMGYGFIIDEDGLVIAHSDKSRIGMNLFMSAEWEKLLRTIFSENKSEYEEVINGEHCTVFTEPVTGNWHMIIVANDSLLFRRIRHQIMYGVILAALIYLIIVIFCAFSVSKIRKAETSREDSMERLRQLNRNSIRALAYTIDAKDRYTSGHSQRVADYAVKIAERMGKSEKELDSIYNAGLLHDIGKIRVPEEVINKAGKLTDEEFDYIRIHPGSGYHILHDIETDDNIVYGAKYHHERYDGKGYPNGLRGTDIPETARIIAIADAYDAMASDRSYRKALPQEVIRDEIRKGKGTQFDPDMADVMLKIIDEDYRYELRQKKEAPQNLLVVDDDPITLKIVGRILSDMDNIIAFSARSKDEALSVVKERNIDLILLDLNFPDTDGFTILEEIRKIRDIPAILLTGDRSTEILKKIREYRMEDYLTKPLNSAITRETVYDVLHGFNRSWDR